MIFSPLAPSFTHLCFSFFSMMSTYVSFITPRCLKLIQQFITEKSSKELDPICLNFESF